MGEVAVAVAMATLIAAAVAVVEVAAVVWIARETAAVRAVVAHGPVGATTRVARQFVLPTTRHRDRGDSVRALGSMKQI